MFKWFSKQQREKEKLEKLMIDNNITISDLPFLPSKNCEMEALINMVIDSKSPDIRIRK